MPDPRPGLRALEAADEFIARHIGISDADAATMLESLRQETVEELVEKAVPRAIRTRTPMDLPDPVSEAAAIAEIRRISEANQIFTSMIGLGYHDTYIPEVIKRNVLENPGWYTAYTPYQAEVSQGRMEILLNFQQMIMDLSGMEIANASLLDEATAAAEAMTMARRVGKSKSQRFFVAHDCLPQTISVLGTRAEPLGFELVIGDPQSDLKGQEYFGALLQYPGGDGGIHDYREIIADLSARQTIVIIAADLLSLALLTPPGELGADIVIGSSQRFGVPMGFGGPHAAFFATRDKLKRSMPGRIIGVSLDSAGRPALRMALQTREQHIRREKATSNICTSQVLLAVLSALYATYHGPLGIERIAQRTNRLCAILEAGLRQLGYTLRHENFFDTLCITAEGKAESLCQKARDQGINLFQIDADRLSLSVNETTTRQHIETLWRVFGGRADQFDIDALDQQVGDSIPRALRRTSDFLTHPVFNSYHNETDMMRYLRSRAAKDIALDRSMIPLGSCTMKLNAAAEMLPVTWPAFGSLHPFAPKEQTRGYQRLFDDLQQWLCACTGFDAVSLQPNAGSQGEYAGLMAIRKYHQSQGQKHRDICLIPASAHGTNPASANMAGLRVIVVKCDKQGNVDLDDLGEKAREHAPALAALMITYPSTHGVYEESIKEICATVHDQGGQVYFDGANLNALLGLARPAELGADVCHFNLHKTFAIPHGGGGPGMGPIGVRAHLQPYLPDHPVVAGVNPAAAAEVGAISAAPWGSASILPISWMCIRMLGRSGLEKSTRVAILSANYLAARLAPHYPVLYTGADGLVAHECIIDVRPLLHATGISIDDVAKRLIDYGFHAPTMSFPVPETLMIEPTESEPLSELDRFCEAMIGIRAEIAEIEQGKADPIDNVLKNAPHSAILNQHEDWDRPYSREQAFYPSAAMKQDKYWAPVGRVDNVHGDRHLVCSCPPMEAYTDD